mgnify:FL=1
MDLTMEIDKIIASRKQLTVNSEKLVVNSQLTTKLLTDKEIAYCLNNVTDLMNPGWEPWYRLRLYKLGVSEFMERAEKSRKYGRDKRKYFSNLLKRY